MAYYMDLFNGDPQAGGLSVLSAITGSSTRQDITAALVATNATTFPFMQQVLTNTDAVLVASSSASITNISFVALYDAPRNGTLLVKSRLGASPTINRGNPVQFNALALTFSTPTLQLSALLASTASLIATLTVTVAPAGEMLSETGIPMITEGSVIMVTET